MGAKRMELPPVAKLAALAILTEPGCKCAWCVAVKEEAKP